MKVKNKLDLDYLDLLKRTKETGTVTYNERTGFKTWVLPGETLKVDLSDGYFPLLTSKKMYWKQMVAEQIGFIRGYTNAAHFRALGCNFWNANANETPGWLANPHRKGEDDLGPIYGAQARAWATPEGDTIDQLKNVVDRLSRREDDRRLIVTHWNPGELHKMALAPCHMMYQFVLLGDRLDVCMYQRSADLPLGVPMNVASYSLLLLLVCQITGLQPGFLHHFMANAHIYENQISLVDTQCSREIIHDEPKIWINPEIKSLNDLETWVTLDDFSVTYESHGPVKYPFAC